MSLNPGHSVLLGNLEAVDQGLRLLDVLTHEQYVYVPSPYVESSIAQHFRHIADMFLALIERAQGEPVNYDRRRRGAKIERCRATAKDELEKIHAWMSTALQAHESGALELSSQVDIQTEVTIEETHSVKISSSLMRELVFASSHAVHHYALISVIAKLQNVSLEEGLGVAPATATFLRGEASVEKDHTSCAP